MADSDENSISKIEIDYIKGAIDEIKKTLAKLLDREENRISRINQLELQLDKYQNNVESRLQAGIGRFSEFDKLINNPEDGIITRLKYIETNYIQKGSSQKTIKEIDAGLGLIMKIGFFLGILLLAGYWIYTTKDHVQSGRYTPQTVIITNR